MVEKEQIHEASILQIEYNLHAKTFLMVLWIVLQGLD